MMGLKTISIMVLILLIWFLLNNFLGNGITTLIFTIIFLVQAIVFTIKSEYYDRFLKFMNPGQYNVYIEKGDDFIRKKRKMNIVSYYILAVIMGFNAFMQIRLANKMDTRNLLDAKEFILFAGVIIIIILIINYISMYTMKKSKTATEDLAWNIIIGVILCIIFIAFLSIQILRLII